MQETQLFTDDELKAVGEDIAEVLRLHGLQHRPDKCRVLFAYMADVVDGWNCSNGQSQF